MKEPRSAKKQPRSFDLEEKEPIIHRVFQLVDRYSSRSQAARAWGINISTLQNYYKRKDITPIPRKAHLIKIAEQEAVSLEWLLTGEGDGPEWITHVKNEKSDVEMGLHHSEKQKKHSNTLDFKLLELLSFLSQDEKQRLIEVFVRKGVETVLYLLDENNIRLLQLPEEERERLLVRHEAKKGAPEDSRGNDFTDPMSKQAG